MYRLTIRVRSDDTIRPNTNTLFGPLFGSEANNRYIYVPTTELKALTDEHYRSPPRIRPCKCINAWIESAISAVQGGTKK